MSEPKGLYQPFFTAAEQRDLTNPDAAPLDDEIKLVRVVMRRMLKIAKGQAEDEQMKSLAQLAAVASRLAVLIRTQEQITRGKTPEDGGLRSMLEKILAEAQASWSVE